MTTTSRKYQELSLEQQIQRVRDAWFARPSGPGSDPGWPIFVYPDHMIIEHADGLFRVPYTVGEDDVISFGEPVKVMQEFVPARDPRALAPPPAPDRRGLSGAAQDFVRATARLFGAHDPEEEKPGEPGLQVRAAGDEGLLLEVPFRVYRDEERYVGGLVLTPGDDNARGDIWEPDDIRLMAHRFMEESRHIDYMHTTKVVGTPIESYYFPTEQEGGQAEYGVYGETVPGGSWWLGSRVSNDEAWEKVKSGELTGYSMFAVKLAKQQSQGNRAYQADMREAPSGRKMTADEWDITMVSLVDKPAVNKATYVIMRRAPDGEPVITRPDIPETGEEGETEMRRIARVVAYHEAGDSETSPETGPGQHPEGQPGPEPGQVPPDGGAGQSEPSSQGAETPPEGNGNTGQSSQDAAPNSQEELVAAVRSVFAEQAGGLREQFQGMIDAAVEPLKQSLQAVETRQARYAGSGALPLNRSTGQASGEETPDQDLSWTNFGTRPRRIESASAVNGQSPQS